MNHSKDLNYDFHRVAALSHIYDIYDALKHFQYCIHTLSPEVAEKDIRVRALRDIFVMKLTTLFDNDDGGIELRNLISANKIYSFRHKYDLKGFFLFRNKHIAHCNVTSHIDKDGRTRSAADDFAKAMANVTIDDFLMDLADMATDLLKDLED